MTIPWGAVGNHLWQSTLFAAVAGFLTIALRANSAQARHRVWLAASLKFLVPFSLLVATGGKLGSLAVPVARKSVVPAAVTELRRPFGRVLATPADVSLDREPGAGRGIAILFAGVWLWGFGLVCRRWHVHWRSVREELRSAHFRTEGREADALRSLVGRTPSSAPAPLVRLFVRSNRPTGLAISRSSMEPAVFGVFRPVLMLPEGIACKLDDAQLRAILAHELCHVRRRDNLAAAMHTIVEALFWFHPLVWWIGARLVEERERACDEEVLRMGSEPAAYAGGILQVCEYCLESPLASVSGVTGADLMERIERIARNRLSPKLGFGRKLLLAAAVTAAISIPIAIGLAQSETFEVATIKPAHYAGGPLRVTPKIEPAGINFENVTLKLCIQRAYGVKPYQVTGPAWIAADRYTILAKSGGHAKEEQLLLMLRTLLADRFKLVSHREMKDMPVYALVVAKNGPKLKESKGGDGITDGSGGPGGVSVIEGHDSPIGILTGVLRQQLDRPVLDETGLEGVYDYKLMFSSQSNQAGSNAGAADAASDPGGAPSIFTALQEQLGLKLEPRRAPIEVIVVDSAEKEPTGN
jgi:bla regulator protein BlaR1